MWFVFYDDDWADNGGVGWREFDFEEDALSYIDERMRDRETEIDRYTLIKGEKLEIAPKDVVTKIQVKK